MKKRILAVILALFIPVLCAAQAAVVPPRTLPPQERVPYLSAEKVARGACKGKITSSGLEQRGQIWYYTFEIQGARSKFEVLVDALSGKLTSQKKISKR